MEILHQELDPEKSSSRGFEFYCESPREGALLDNEVFVEYTLRVGTTDFGEVFGGDGISVDKADELLAFRQCWPIARAMTNLRVRFNKHSITTTPYKWIDAMNRLCISYEEAETICTMSGGEFDTGLPFAISRDEYEKKNTASGADPLEPTLDVYVITGFSSGSGTDEQNIVPGYPDSYQFENGGYTTRCHRLIREGRRVGALDAAIGNARFGGANDFIIKVRERLPIHPFYFYDSKDKRGVISGIKTMRISASFGPETVTRVMQATNFSEYTFDIHAEAPKLQLSWKMLDPPPSIPASIPYLEYVTYTQQVTVPAVNPGSVLNDNYTSYTFKQIYLREIPQMILIYIRRAFDEINGPSEFFLSMDSLDIRVGAMQKLCTLRPAKMYSIYLKNTQHKGLKKIPFHQWYHYNCVAALLPSDIGMAKISQGLQFSAKASAASKWAQPSMYTEDEFVFDDVDTEYEFTVLAIYKSLIRL